MIEIENVETMGWEHAIRGMRNPMNSWGKSDSLFIESTDKSLIRTEIGPSDHKLMMQLIKGGPAHGKFRRMIAVYLDIIAPLYWWKEYDTYKVGTVANSCSTMHKIHAKEFELEDFSLEHLVSEYSTRDYFTPDYDESTAKICAVEGYPDYEVSEYGKVYSNKSGERKELKQGVDIDGYKTVGLYKDGFCKRFKVHRLVANSFLPKDETKKYINHKDGNKWNNAINNLEWCTCRENSLHAAKNRLMVYGSKQRLGKARKRRFSKEQVERIKTLYSKERITQRKLGEMFGCDHSVISEIVNNKIYKEITVFPLEIAEIIVDELNRLRDAYLESGDREYWYSIIQLLPSSYNQRRTVMLNYEVLASIYRDRRNHKLDEWHTFCDWIETLPYSELITGGNADE